ncbi:hypothetical protein [Nevskia ramosa]|uniref:hypothetical protein n=1 Tax=Nevskia ramosa TaxID=64002 RepID=UPI003D10BD06
MTAVKMPSADDLHIAAQWLDIYDGDGSADYAACHRVAAWLRQKSDDAELREAAAAAGVTMARVRAAMKARKG